MSRRCARRVARARRAYERGESRMMVSSQEARIRHLLTSDTCLLFTKFIVLIEDILDFILLLKSAIVSKNDQRLSYPSERISVPLTPSAALSTWHPLILSLPPPFVSAFVSVYSPSPPRPYPRSFPPSSLLPPPETRWLPRPSQRDFMHTNFLN